MLATGRKISLWEQVATLELMQSLKLSALMSSEENELLMLCLPKLPTTEPNPLDDKTYLQELAYDTAYRQVESTDQPYVYSLCVSSGLIPQPFVPLTLPNIPGDNGPIIICPFGLKRELDLPLPVWKALVKFLHSYDLPVYVMGDDGQRTDGCSFPENNILSYSSLPDKVQALATACLIVGVPNAFTWLACAWEKKQIILYPDTIPPMRWFWHSSPHIGRCVYQAHQIQIPVMLAGVRKLISEL